MRDEREHVGEQASSEDVPAAHACPEDATESEPAGETLLELVLAEHARSAEEAAPEPARIDGVVVGRLVEIAPGGEPLVDFAGNPGAAPIAARAMLALDATFAGREVALLFEGGDARKPIVMGLMHTPQAAAPTAAPTEATADGERLVFEAGKEIVLRCGSSSITLTRAGKILIKGAYVLSRSSGVNRILGGSVQIN
jgi:hypothetical protein